jgi:hypothetical protein
MIHTEVKASCSIVFHFASAVVKACDAHATISVIINISVGKTATHAQHRGIRRHHQSFVVIKMGQAQLGGRGVLCAMKGKGLP